MVRKEEIIVGHYLRTCSNSFVVPAGTLAKVDSVGTTWQGEFVFTVRWLNWRTGTQFRPVTGQSLNLWEQDLAHFEAVQEVPSRATVPPPSRQPKLALQIGAHRKFSKRKLANIGQLSLFTSEEFSAEAFFHGR